MGDALPRLTKPQFARLVEIGAPRGRASYRDSPAITKGLQTMGLVEPLGGKVAKTGRVIWHADAVLTPLGIRVLAGLPGPEFDQFRALVARAEAEEPDHAG